VLDDGQDVLALSGYWWRARAPVPQWFRTSNLLTPLDQKYLCLIGRRYGIYLVYWIAPHQRPVGWSRRTHPDREKLKDFLTTQAAEVTPDLQITRSSSTSATLANERGPQPGFACGPSIMVRISRPKRSLRVCNPFRKWRIERKRPGKRGFLVCA